MDEKTLSDLERRREEARQMGGPDALDKLATAGKLNARQRLDALLDPDSFVELGVLGKSQHRELAHRTPADGLVAGHGTIDGRTVYVTSEDASVLGGTRGRVAEAKTARIRSQALRHGKPFIALMEAGAGRFQENNGAFAAGIGHRFREHFALSGRVPQVAAIMGGCFGGPSFTAMQSDFVTITEGTGFIGMSGPKVVKVGIGKTVSADDIGGSEKSAKNTGQADCLATDDTEALEAIRTFLSFLPSSSDELPSRATAKTALSDTEEGRAELAALVSENGRRAYDMQRLIQLVVDDANLFPYRPLYGPNLITTWARIDGWPVGIIANNPMHWAGALDDKAAQKARKFVDICDAFHIPLVFLTDCPGFIVGPEIENQRMVSLASRLLNTIVGAQVPILTVVVRKAIGLAYIALGAKVMDPDLIVGWPTAQFDVMGPAAGVELVHGREIEAAADPKEMRRDLLAQAEKEAAGYLAAEAGLIDDIIHPAETRRVLADALARSVPAMCPGFKHRIDP